MILRLDASVYTYCNHMRLVVCYHYCGSLRHDTACTTRAAMPNNGRPSWLELLVNTSRFEGIPTLNTTFRSLTLELLDAVGLGIRPKTTSTVRFAARSAMTTWGLIRLSGSGGVLDCGLTEPPSERLKPICRTVKVHGFLALRKPMGWDSILGHRCCLSATNNVETF